jgi:hypothetical protein
VVGKVVVPMTHEERARAWLRSPSIEKLVEQFAEVEREARREVSLENNSLSLCERLALQALEHRQLTQSQLDDVAAVYVRHYREHVVSQMITMFVCEHAGCTRDPIVNGTHCAYHAQRLPACNCHGIAGHSAWCNANG